MLRLNRTISSLCLADNEITDCGVKALTDVLQEFPLTNEEQVQRGIALVMAGLSPTTTSARLPVLQRQQSTVVPQHGRTPSVQSNTKANERKVSVLDSRNFMYLRRVNDS